MSTAGIADLAAACQAIGRSAVSAARVRELAGAQDGLQLDVLDSDAAALAAAAAAAQEALDAASSATGVLAQAWRGGTGSAATEFLQRQCASGNTVIEQLTAAAVTLRRLREELSRQLDIQEAATARVQTPGAWLSAARAVLTGRAGADAGADAVAIVTGQIAPYVDTVVAGEWAPAVESATTVMSAAYRQAIAELSDRSPVRFETPAMPAAVPSVPASGAPSAAPVPPPAAFTTPQIPSIPDFGLPDLGGALLPLVNAIASALGGYSGSPSVDPSVDTAAPPAKPGATGSAHTPKEKAAAELKPRPEPKAEPVPEPVPEPQPKPAAPVTAPLPPPLAAEAPVTASPPVQAERTPCEIAADELPQVGG